MDYEILGTEDDELTTPEPPRRPVGALVGAVVALGALVTAAMLFGAPGDWAGQTAVDPSPTPNAHMDEYRDWAISNSGMVSPPAVPPRAELSVGPVCDPVVAPGGKSLRVQFELINSGATQLRLREVRPYFPLPGFLKLGSESAGGTCTDPGTEKPARYLAAGERVLITWDLTLQKKCPQPAPVQVAVRARLITGNQSLQFPLFDDLGAIPFSGC